MIDAKYKRGLDHNYLVIEETEDNNIQNDYSVKMIQRNKMKGLLEISTEMNNDINTYMYEISSLQPLTRLYERLEMDFEALKKMLENIIKAIDNINEFMLDDSKIIVLPEYIYLNVENHNLKLMYYPKYKGDVRNDFMRLAEFILDKVNHKNEKAVMMAYSIYRTVRNDNFTIDSLRKIIKANKVEKVDKENIEDIEDTGDIEDIEDIEENTISQIDKYKKEILTNESFGEEKEFLKPLIGKKKKNCFGGHIKANRIINDVFNRILPGKNNTESVLKIENMDTDSYEAETAFIISEKENLYNEDCIRNEYSDGHYKYCEKNAIKHDSHINIEKNNDIIICEKNNNIDYRNNKTKENDEVLTEVYGQTVLLSDEGTYNSKSGYRLKDNDNDKIYEILSFPVTIGKIRECVDIVLNDNSVSRIHAKIFEKEGKIFLKDLGSRNGTFVNSVILTNEEEIFLEDKDEIRIGRINLVFQKN